ncbi:hypothetical protein AVEN_119951-1 [Araneus ventricosus]|uniref:Uncharacterized protein n=1 Tax=Araneus ventricosus TaxID=182803 RepID=A0A4Y2ICK7_ARAVE|nr:hypothetical protein AVEN_119951-1 [Araneus ventricosus]
MRFHPHGAGRGKPEGSTGDEKPLSVTSYIFFPKFSLSSTPFFFLQKWSSLLRPWEVRMPPFTPNFFLHPELPSSPINPSNPKKLFAKPLN